MAALPLQELIAEDTDVKVMYHTLLAQFGNGAEQVAANGLNNRETVWTVVYNNLTESQANTVLIFIHSLNGVTSFTATLPAEATAKNWKINPDSLSIKYVTRHNQTNENYRTISFSCRSRD